MNNTEKQKPVAVINGAYGGIGSAVAFKLAQEGYNLALLGRDFTKLKELSNQITQQEKDCSIHIYKTDATNFKSMKITAEYVQNDFQKVDALIHTVGSAPVGNFLSTSPESWAQAIETSLMSHIYFAKTFSQILIKQNFGKIILINGVLSIQPDPNLIISSTTTGAVRNFAKAISKEFGQYNVTVNIVNPGPTQTSLWEKVSEKLSYQFQIETDEFNELVKQNCPLKKIASPDDVADTVVFLCSSKASFLNGTSITVDGGGVSALS